MFATVALIAGSLGCSATSNDTKTATAGLRNITQNLTANEWTLDRVASSPRIGGTTPITLTFTTDHKLSGTGTCNNYFASFSVDQDTIKVGPIGQTLRGCDPGASAAEHAYLDALGAVTSVPPTDRDQLELRGSGGIRLKYQAHVAKRP